MKKIINIMLVMALVIAAIIMAGCQTRVTATKNAETVTILQDGSPLVTSGGWEFTARSPLYAAEALDGFSAEISTNGSVKAALNKYARDTSTNAVAMVNGMFSGGAQLATAIGEAYTKIAGGGAQAATVTETTAKIINYFKSSGGDESKATVTTTEDGKVKVSDGTTCVECTADGTCTNCTP